MEEQGVEACAKLYDDVWQELLANEEEKRAWCKLVLAVLNARSHEADPTKSVQTHYDMMAIEACNRMIRILRSDLYEVD